MGSRLGHPDDGLIVREGHDFRNLYLSYVRQPHFYFVIPDFLLTKPWPPEREWRWHPGVKISQGKLKELLDLEIRYGGWMRNRRGIPLIPYRTGCSGTTTAVKPRQGWATQESLVHWSSTKMETLDLFDDGETLS
jgi:hypothetical protein